MKAVNYAQSTKDEDIQSHRGTKRAGEEGSAKPNNSSRIGGIMLKNQALGRRSCRPAAAAAKMGKSGLPCGFDDELEGESSSASESNGLNAVFSGLETLAIDGKDEEGKFSD